MANLHRLPAFRAPLEMMRQSGKRARNGYFHLQKRHIASSHPAVVPGILRRSLTSSPIFISLHRSRALSELDFPSMSFCSSPSCKPFSTSASSISTFRLGVAGCGAMGSSLVAGVLNASLLTHDHIFLYDVRDEAIEYFQSRLGKFTALSSNKDLAEQSDVVLLCTKPKDASSVIDQLNEAETPVLVISVCAGVTLSVLERNLNPIHRVIRAMPNTPALISQGCTAFAKGEKATDSDLARASAILGAVGSASLVPEDLMDAVTGVSGSGPAYVYMMIEAMADGGVLMGLTKPQALDMAARTVKGAAQLVLESGQHPSVLRDEVCSPGGTTISGVAALERENFRNALISAVKDASLRSKELGHLAESSSKGNK